MPARGIGGTDGVAGSNSIKPESGRVFPSHVASNDGETAKKRECTAIMIVFRRNPDVV
jgi:hypothetical protein